jgi:hypothetical protein
MGTGKVEYAPDYKSRVRQAVDEGRRIADSIIANNRLSAEHQRLQSAVVEAAKTWKQSNPNDDAQWNVNYPALCQSIDALIVFEAEYGIGEK